MEKIREFDSINAQGSGTISGTAVDKDQRMPSSVAANGKEETDFELEYLVSAARIRDVPDVNAAESVSWLTGISLIRSGGEGQKVYELIESDLVSGFYEFDFDASNLSSGMYV